MTQAERLENELHKLDSEINEGERMLQFVYSRIEELTDNRTRWVNKLNYLNAKRNILKDKINQVK